MITRISSTLVLIRTHTPLTRFADNGAERVAMKYNTKQITVNQNPLRSVQLLESSTRVSHTFSRSRQEVSVLGY